MPLAGLVVVAAYAGALVALFWPAWGSRPFARRLAQLEATLPAPGAAAAAEAAAERPRDRRSLRRRLARWLNRTAARSFSNLQIKLTRAGRRSQRAPIVFLVAKLIVPFVAMGLAWLYLGATVLRDAPPLGIITLSAAVGIAAIWAPDLMLRNMIQRYQEKIQKAWPDTLDLLHLCIEAGLGLEAAVSKVAREIAVSSPEMAAELTITVAELAYLQDRRRAVENLGTRVDIAMVREATKALSQAEAYGMPLNATLRTLAEETRRLRLAAVEKKANALPSRLRIPLILFFLPVLFVVILAPAAFEIIRNF
ncbi:type II secretion system F family protein [Rhodosalinus sediminis]|uniref:type II secretion system F family protein n=1 Tax=Rhodosalinus sediminis TaxID=1940533 RepID=UPI002354F291|nr:type II secretion system F family protein [Rhodosalinus sediminis]